MVRVERRPNESDRDLVRRFKKAVGRAKVLSEARRNRWHMSKSEQRRLARKKAIRRQQRINRKRKRRRESKGW